MASHPPPSPWGSSGGPVEAAALSGRPGSTRSFGPPGPRPPGTRARSAVTSHPPAVPGVPPPWRLAASCAACLYVSSRKCAAILGAQRSPLAQSAKATAEAVGPSPQQAGAASAARFPIEWPVPGANRRGRDKVPGSRDTKRGACGRRSARNRGYAGRTAAPTAAQSARQRSMRARPSPGREHDGRIPPAAPAWRVLGSAGSAGSARGRD